MPNVLDAYMSQEELAQQLGRSPRTLGRWRRLGEGPKPIRIGKEPFYPRDAVKAWLESLAAA